MAIVLETSLTHLLVFIFSLLSQLYTLHLNNNTTLRVLVENVIFWVQIFGCYHCVNAKI
jgi:hypothetical protein